MWAGCDTGDLVALSCVIANVLMLAAGDDLWRHDIADLRGHRIPSVGHCPNHYIAFGEQANQSVPVADYYCPDVLLSHLPGRLL